MSPAAPPASRAAARWWPWALGAIVALHLLTRLPDLMRLPVFLDEAMHLDWAFRTAATGQLVGHTDGGRYLPIWAYAVVAGKAADPLRAARLCSVASGLAAVLGLAWLGRLLETPQAGLLAAFLYVAAPFTLLYDRMALVDSLLAALVVYALVFGVLWVRTARRLWAIGLGLALGAAGLTKLSGLLTLAIPAALAFASRSHDRHRLRAQLAWPYGIAVVLLVPLFLDLAGTGRFFSENLWVLRAGADGESFVGRNARLAGEWLLAYLTPIGAALVSAAVAWALRGRERADLLLLCVALGWCAFFVLAGGRYWFPRYVLPAIPPLLLLLARGAERLGPAAMWLTAGLLAVTWARFDAALIADPARAPLPPVERSQYIYDWPSGYGLAEVTAALRQVAARQPVTVLRDQSSTPLREGLDLMLRGGGARIDVVDAPVKAGEFGDSIERLIASDRLVLLAIDQPAERQLVLSLDGRRAVPPWAEISKPDGVRAVAVYAVAGEAPPAAAPAGAAAVAASGGPGQGSGVGLWLLGRRDEAVRELAEALRLDTEDLRAGYNLAVARNAMLRGR
jgi:dolichyl-phosphate-mannose-protein mannosyltransferase